jgi:hypothetical protein
MDQKVTRYEFGACVSVVMDFFMAVRHHQLPKVWNCETHETFELRVPDWFPQYSQLSKIEAEQETGEDRMYCRRIIKLYIKAFHCWPKQDQLVAIFEMQREYFDAEDGSGWSAWEIHRLQYRKRSHRDEWTHVSLSR